MIILKRQVAHVINRLGYLNFILIRTLMNNSSEIEHLIIYFNYHRTINDTRDSGIHNSIMTYTIVNSQ